MDEHILAWTSATKAIKSNLHCLLTKALLLASELHPLIPHQHTPNTKCSPNPLIALRRGNRQYRQLY